MYGLVLPSGADAAEALAIMVAGSNEEFAKLMNENVKSLDLSIHILLIRQDYMMKNSIQLYQKWQ